MFCNILDGFDRICFAEIAKEQHRLRELYLKSPTVSKEDVKAKCVKDFKAFVLKRAPTMLVHEKQECLICDCQCLRRPPSDDDSLWLELISPSCVHWSSQGGHLGWLGDGNLPLLHGRSACATTTTGRT